MHSHTQNFFNLFGQNNLLLFIYFTFYYFIIHTPYFMESEEGSLSVANIRAKPENKEQGKLSLEKNKNMEQIGFSSGISGLNGWDHSLKEEINVAMKERDLHGKSFPLPPLMEDKQIEGANYENHRTQRSASKKSQDDEFNELEEEEDDDDDEDEDDIIVEEEEEEEEEESEEEISDDEFKPRKVGRPKGAVKRKPGRPPASESAKALKNSQKRVIHKNQDEDESWCSASDDEEFEKTKKRGRKRIHDHQAISTALPKSKRIRNDALASLILESDKLLNFPIDRDSLENRAKALIFKEWELECSRIKLDRQTEKYRMEEALRVISSAKRKLTKLQSEIERISSIVPEIDFSFSNAFRFVYSMEVLNNFFCSFEDRINDRLTGPHDSLPDPPNSNSYLELIPSLKDQLVNGSSNMIFSEDEDDEFIEPLLSFSKAFHLEIQSQQNSPRQASPNGGNEVKRRGRAGRKPSSLSLIKEKEKEVSPPSCSRIEAIEAVPLKISPHGEEQYSLKYNFTCDEFNIKVQAKFQAAVDGNVFKNLRGNFSDPKSPDYPKRVDTVVICLPPLSNMAGRLPTCGLCGLTVRRDDFRGRALKNGTKYPCLVHSFHSYCLAYLQVTCKSVCIATLMGVASPCNLNERSRIH